MIARKKKEVRDTLEFANDQVDAGKSAYPGMSYEEGVSAAMRWLLGESEDAPFEDEVLALRADEDEEDEDADVPGEDD